MFDNDSDEDVFEGLGNTTIRDAPPSDTSSEEEVKGFNKDRIKRHQTNPPEQGMVSIDVSKQLSLSLPKISKVYQIKRLAKPNKFGSLASSHEDIDE